MNGATKLDDSVIKTFLKFWNRHPISIAVVNLYLMLSFVFILSHNVITKDNIYYILGGCYALFCFVIGYILLLLNKNRNVLYDPKEVLISELTHRKDYLQEILGDIKIGIGNTYDEKLEWLCPKTAEEPITDQMRSEIIILEFLSQIEQSCYMGNKLGMLTNYVLSKFYYKEGKFDKALDKINCIKIGKLSSKKPIIETEPGDFIHPNEVYFCKGLILGKLKREKEGRKYLKMAMDAQHESAKCWWCAYTIVNSQTQSEGGIIGFINKAIHCRHSSANENCINMLSTAHYLKARYFTKSCKLSSATKCPHKKSIFFSSNCKQNNVRECYLKEAVKLIDTAINLFDSWVAHFNKACDLSVMANHDINPYITTTALDKNNKLPLDCIEKIKDDILYHLGKSFSKKPALIKFCMKETDLQWLKYNYEKEFFELLGKTYCNNYNVI